MDIANLKEWDGLAPDLNIPMEEIVNQLISQRAGDTAYKRALQDPEVREAQSAAGALRDKAQSMLGREFYIELEKALIFETARFDDYIYKQGFKDGIQFIMAMK